MNLSAHIAFMEQNVLATFRNAFWPSALISDIVVFDTFAEDSSLGVNIHFTVVKTQAKDIVETITF